MRKLFLTLLPVLFLQIFCSQIFAYDLTLTAVGSQSTLGVDYSLVNYTGGVPTLTGTASPSAQIGVNINTLLRYTVASTSGIWQFVPSALSEGDNTVVLSSGSQTISFILRFNSTESGEIATPAALMESELLDSGVWEYYIPAVFLGLLILGMGRFGRRWMQKWEKGD
ncbi:MAG TPA: hypothetical protein PLI45_03855 [Candidatus Woesebacteria bacterium]|nr:hypothetical protein [Candidatus Woesebacteria bacterium]